MAFEIRFVVDVPELPSTTKELARIATALEQLLVVLRRPSMPGTFNIRAELECDDMLKFSVVGIPAPKAADVVARELTVKVGAADPSVFSLAVDQAEFSGLSGEQGDSVEVSLVDIDDNDNRSEPRVLSFTLTDTIAPPQPDEFNIRVDEEV